MTNEHVCILGASGFLGQHLTRHLLQSGCRVRTFAKQTRPNPLLKDSDVRNLSCHDGDFFQQADLFHALEGCTSCIHLVSTMLPKTANDNPILDVEQNLVGTLRFLECAREVGIRKVVFASSGGTVYGLQQQQKRMETDATNPISSYGIVKLAIEKYLYLYGQLYGLSSVALRISNPYGPLQNTNSMQGIVGTFMSNVLKNKPLVVWGDGSIVRDYIYIDDVVRAFSLALQTSQTTHAVFNIGSGCGTSIKQLLQYIEETVQRPLQIEYQDGRISDVPYSVLDTSHAEKHLQWKPKTTLAQGLQHTWNWMTTYC